MPRPSPFHESSSIGFAALRLTTAIAACRTTPPAATDSARDPARAIVEGFDPAEAGGDWRIGDRLLYTLSTETPTVKRSQLVELELLGPSYLPGASPGSMQLVQYANLTATVGSHTFQWRSPLLRVGVRVHETDGRLLQTTEAKVPETVLRQGMYPFLVMCEERKAQLALSGTVPPELTDHEMRVYADAVAMMPTLLEILQDDGVLESLLKQAIGPPPLLSLLRGLHLSVSFGLERAGPIIDHAHPCGPGAMFRVPVRLDVNDSPMLELEFEIATADPPLRLSGGILRLRGQSVRGAKRTLTLELLAARRGPPGAEIRL